MPLIILVSGRGKYHANEEQFSHVESEGKTLFELLKEKKDIEFSNQLKALHDYIARECKQVDILKIADWVVPPVDCDPVMLREIMGI